MNIHLIRLDPYDPNLGVLVPIVGKRIIEYAKEYLEELDPIQVARGIMVPLWNRDPFTLVLAMVNTEGMVVGHAVVGVTSDGGNNWVTVAQTQADGAVGDAVKRAIEYSDKWVYSEVNPLLVAAGRPPVKQMVMVTGKNEKAWERAYGFKLDRRVMTRPLGGVTGEEGSQEDSG